MELWFKENPNFLCATKVSRFLNQKTQMQCKLASVTNKPEFIKQLSFMLKQLQDEDQASSSMASGDKQGDSVQSESNEEFIIDLNKD